MGSETINSFHAEGADILAITLTALSIIKSKKFKCTYKGHKMNK